jgi:phosphohistidine phosphatase
MKTLILCRHAKSDWPTSTPDISRPLKPRGEEDAKYLGGILEAQALMPDRILTSPAVRALRTAEIVARKLRYKGEIDIQPAIYHKDEDGLFELIRHLPPSLETVMIFGHNPTMENAVRYLLQCQSAFTMPTCGMACFETYADDWSGLNFKNSTMRWYLIPRLRRTVE